MSPPSLDVDLELLHWPAEADRRAALAASGTPRLLLLEPGVAPPRSWAEEEDWVRLPASPDELAARAAGLPTPPRTPRLAAPVVLDAAGTVTGADASVELTPIGAELLLHLLDRWARPVEVVELEAVLLAGAPRAGTIEDELLGLGEALAAVGIEVVDLGERTVLLTTR
jgi:hypothetical protein